MRIYDTLNQSTADLNSIYMESFMNSKRLRFAYGFMVVAILLQGCGLTSAQRKDIGTFGQAASTLGASSKDQLLAGRENVIEMKRFQLAIEKIVLPTTQPDGSPPTRDFFFSKTLNLDSGLDKNDIDIRVAAVDLLHKYGTLLVTFTTDTHEKELKDSSDKFLKCVGNFPSNPLTPDEIKGLGQIVTAVGGILVEHQKKEALEKIVPKVSPLIYMICDILERDFDLKKKGIYANIHFAQDRLASEAIDGLKQPGNSLSDRLLLIDGFALAEKNQNYLATTSRQLLKSIASLRKANSQLIDVININRIGLQEIKEFGEDAAKLSKGVKPFINRF